MKVPTSRIKHVVVMMFENRSFDSMLGFLYKDNNNKSPLGHPFEGLTGTETNPDSNGNSITVFPIDKNDSHAYFMPKKDPGEGFANTNFQLFGAGKAPYPKGIANNQGFVRDFENPIDNSPLEKKEHPYKKSATNTTKASSDHDYKSDDYKKWYKKPSPSGHASDVPDLDGVAPKDIMGMYTPETLPVLSGLATGYAVCDHWYCSAPTETLPNRAFTHMGTSEGYLYDEIHSYSSKSIFKHLMNHNKSWGIFGNNGKPYTVSFCQDIPSSLPKNCQVGSFDTFKTALKEKNLPDYTFLEPIWGSQGNSQHPNYNVALGEQYLLDIYTALKESPHWEDTLLVITYDEHGGCYDHITPPNNATSPPAKSTAFGFDFTRYGVRVPTVLISPWIEAGTVYRTKGDVPLDHTSILATLEKNFNVTPLTDRDKAAPDVLDVLTLSKPRTDTPLKGITAPVANSTIKIQNHASQIQQMHAAALTDKHNRETGEAKTTPDFKTEEDVKSYINTMHTKYYS
ncbi:Non-hemolytic phospholipase C [Kordia antarctica]|uniref:Non-hemolytic phospholipase C n=1 Tax=Kordia antarctica TaxID=1218801 RepID=A0A7L4ZEE6_9FLAO|nr:alkaline phosphatase family protein [Kordia antarctica]QHI35122.1 Non-hemolytic phospholipase C [Kordia antarctica]